MKYANVNNASILIDEVIAYDNYVAVPDIQILSGLFARFFGSSNEVSIIANLLNVEIVAVMREPYGCRSSFFKPHPDHGFESRLLVTAKGHIEHPNEFVQILNVCGDVFYVNIPIFLNSVCIGYVYLGSFKLDDGETHPVVTSIPMISMQSLEYSVSELCKIGARLLEYSHQHLLADTFDKRIDFNSIFNYGNYFDFNIVNDTFVLSKPCAETLGMLKNDFFTLKEFYAMLEPEMQNKISRYLRQSVLINGNNCNCFSFETKIIRPSDNHEGWIEVKGIVLKDDNFLPVRALGSVLDITKLKTMLLKQEEELESKTRLLKIVGHDLKNPFNGLIGFGELLCKSIEQKKYDEAVDYAQIIKESASEGYDLLVNILDYSNSLVKHLTVKSTVFAPYEDVESVIRLTAAQASRKGIGIVNKIPKDLQITADEYKISTVFRNLISNALKFSFQNENIIVTAQELEDSKVKFSVSDRGMEIPQDKLDLINMAHTVESSEGTAAEKGTSIGLRLCCRYLKVHNSKLVATSNQNDITFSFVI
ncbi:MAG: HAMP domain-containing histidine kinase [Bacteroidales bacterium]|nr:HAMP domain-containing histidine kinase [Bacteroidales bacterium]